MAIFKCKMCGGSIEFEPGSTVGVCDSCGTKQTLPRLDDDRRANLYDRANHLRRNNEYDKAATIYEQILNEDDTDAEACWSLVLCRYGIEYVEDPDTRKMVPTVNRTQFTSVFDDANYKAALKNAVGYQRTIYEEEAQKINEIQKGILDISQKEEPFDVFICYKETDKNGRRTQDSVLANDLYHQLTQEGFKVFFSRIVLEDKLGTAYEPYIFAALNSAKVMVALGTKPEYFNAVWVKNEWSRYLALVKESNGVKTLIPAYKDMDPYDLPEEFAHLQALDMGKLGFMQDLIRGIKKLTRTDAQKTLYKESVTVSGSANIDALLKRVNIFLEDGSWKEADEYCERILDQDPENPQAYIGKLMAELHARKREDLANCEKPFDDNSNYLKALRFGGEKIAAELNGYISCIKDRNEKERIERIYTTACSDMEKADTELELKAISETFKNISGYKDADDLARQCLFNAETCRKDTIYAQALMLMKKATVCDYESAIEKFKMIPGWKDADIYISVCQSKMDSLKKYLEAERLDQERKIKEERVAKERSIARRKLLDKIGIIGISVIVVIAVIVLVDYFVVFPKIRDAVASESYRESLAQADVGFCVVFGSYEQDNNESNGKEDIEWIVLAKEDDRVLLVSRYALDCRKYNMSREEVLWDDSSIRSWLNGTFIRDAFSSSEQELICMTQVEDKVFLLSLEETQTYFRSGNERVCYATPYAEEKGVYRDNSNACWYWLRSTGSSGNRVLAVCADGSIYEDGLLSDSEYVAVRPALWIDLDD